MNRKHAKCLNVSLLLAALTCPAGAISAPETSPFTITIHVYNYAAVPEKTLARAKDEGGQIFKVAGLTTQWLDHPVTAGDGRNPQDSTDSWDDTHFVLRLFAFSRKGLNKNAMGEALSRRIANVFIDRVTEVTVVGKLSAGQVLGHATAHEIGHHLLGQVPLFSRDHGRQVVESACQAHEQR